MRAQGLWCCLVVLCFGCAQAPEGPKVETFPVAGQVLTAEGRPVSLGFVSMRDTKNPDQICSSKVDVDGNFNLTSLVGENRVDGGREGEYVVMYAPESSSQEMRPSTLKKTYKIEKGQSELTINLE